MKISELRALVRAQLKNIMTEAERPSFLSQVATPVASKLGGRRQQLDRILASIDSDRLSRLPREQKVDLLVALMAQFGIDNRDFSAIKSRVQRSLSATASADAAAPTDMGMPTESKVTKRALQTEAEYETPAAPTVKGTLAGRGERLQKTQAFQQLVKALETQPSTKQADYILDLLTQLPLSDPAKQRLKLKIRSSI